MNQYNQQILRLTLPSIVTNITVPLLGLVDLAIVGHIGSETMIGAIAVGSMMFNVMYWLMGFLRMSTTGITAQGGTSHAHRLSLIIAATILLLQIPIFQSGLWLMGPSQEVAEYVRVYFNICIWGAPAVLSLYVFTGRMIGMQDTKTPMIVSITQNIINICASLLLVLGFKMNIEGVALGTIIAQWSGTGMAWILSRPTKHSTTAQLINSSMNRNINLNLFLRTVCLVSVNLFFTSAGARQGDMMLAVNTLMMTFFTLFSYVMDGFANAGEALCGKYHDSMAERQIVIHNLFRWGWIMVGAFTVAYAIGGNGLLGILTSEQSVIDAALTYLPWTLLIPIAGMAAFVYDGIFVGLLNARGMLLACLLATVAFFSLYLILFPLWGNHALWFSFIVFLAIRGVVQHIIVNN